MKLESFNQPTVVISPEMRQHIGNAAVFAERGQREEVTENNKETVTYTNHDSVTGYTVCVKDTFYNERGELEAAGHKMVIEKAGVVLFEETGSQVVKNLLAVDDPFFSQLAKTV